MTVQKPPVQDPVQKVSDGTQDLRDAVPGSSLGRQALETHFPQVQKVNMVLSHYLSLPKHARGNSGLHLKDSMCTVQLLTWNVPVEARTFSPVRASGERLESHPASSACGRKCLSALGCTLVFLALSEEISLFFIQFIPHDISTCFKST